MKQTLILILGIVAICVIGWLYINHSHNDSEYPFSAGAPDTVKSVPVVIPEMGGDPDSYQSVDSVAFNRMMKFIEDYERKRLTDSMINNGPKLIPHLIHPKHVRELQ